MNKLLRLQGMQTSPLAMFVESEETLHIKVHIKKTAPFLYA
jgi:hypothetical protein